MRRYSLISLILIIMIILVTFITGYRIFASDNVSQSMLEPLNKFIQDSFDNPEGALDLKQYFHQDAIFPGNDTFNVVIVPNNTSNTWKIQSTDFVFEDRNIIKPGKEKLLKVVVKYNAIAQATITNNLTFKKINKLFFRTFYLSEVKKQWLILDMTNPEFCVLTKEKALLYAEKIGKTSGNSRFIQLKEKLQELN